MASLNDIKFKSVIEDTVRYIVLSWKRFSSGYDKMSLEVSKEFLHFL